jgi:formate hydrogenlyase subunit 6/NADH:ubiquinone oxidoreductase subunit I
MLNRMSLQLLRQWVDRIFTNPFPLSSMPDSLSETMKEVETGKVSIHPPIEPKGYFRGRLDYDKARCIGCRLCVRVCPANATEFLPDEKKIQIHTDRCCFCAQCTEICPVKCLSMSREFLISSYDRKEQIVVDSGSPQKEEKVEAEKRQADQREEAKQSKQQEQPEQPEQPEEPSQSKQPELPESARQEQSMPPKQLEQSGQGQPERPEELLEEDPPTPSAKEELSPKGKKQDIRSGASFENKDSKNKRKRKNNNHNSNNNK